LLPARHADELVGSAEVIALPVDVSANAQAA
jgi:hypothetical protein